MLSIFAVIRVRGPRWDNALPMEQQKDWREHADFMNGLHADGFILFGGPLEGTSEILLIVRAKSPEEITARLAGDCWSNDDLLRIGRIVPWKLRLGSLD